MNSSVFHPFICHQISTGYETQNIEEMHRDHVPALPPNFHLLGSTVVSPNQGMLKFSDDGKADLDNVHVLTVQGHPEFDESIVNAIVKVRSQAGIIDLLTAEDAARRSGWRNDGLIVGKAIWKVLNVV